MESDNPYETDEYFAFVDEMSQYCICSRGPCDGVLMGSICDGLVDEDRDDEACDQGWDSDEY